MLASPTAKKALRGGDFAVRQKIRPRVTSSQGGIKRGRGGLHWLGEPWDNLEETEKERAIPFCSYEERGSLKK